VRAHSIAVLNGVTLRPGLIASRLSSGGIGVDRPSNACAHEFTGLAQALGGEVPRQDLETGTATIMTLDLYILNRYIST
jgi:hypothetical protein